MKRILVWFVAGLALSLLAIQTVIKEETLLFAIVAVCAVLIVMSIIVRPMRMILPLLFGVLFAFIWMQTYTWMFPQSHHIGSEKEVRVIAVAQDYSYPAKNGNGFWCLCRVEEINAVAQNGGTVIDVYFKTKRLNLRPGDRVEFDAELLPFENSDDFMEFTYYKTRFVDARAYVERFEVFECETIPFRYFPKVVSNLLRKRGDHLFGSASGLIRALITGDRKMIRDRQSENFRVTGLSHVVAVSGMHVALLTAFVVLVFGRRRAPLLATPLILLFGMIIGPIPSVIRAIFMQCAVLFAPLLKREADGVTTLAGALGFLLVINPYSILDIGLLLSFGATLGLILYAQPLFDVIYSHVKTKNKLLRRVLHYFVSTFAASICAMIFTTPISMVYFGSLSLIAPLSNVLTLWSVSILFVGGILTATLSLISPLVAYYLALPIKFLGLGFLWVVDLLAKIPYALIDAQNPFVIFFVLYVFAVLLCISLAKRRKPSVLAGTLLILIPFVVMVATYALKARVTDVSATVFDVGHGQTILVETPSETLLVDCGSMSKDAGNIVYDHLLKRAERTIDAFVLTHLDEDHMSGAEEVLGRLYVSKLYVHADCSEDEKFEHIKECAEENGTEIVLVRFEKEVLFSEVRLTFYPVKDGKTSMLGVNVSHDTNDLLITGDMSARGERYLLDSYPMPDVEHYVVGHHGSKYSSSDEFLDVIMPEYAYISVDSNNQHGHPHEEVLKKLLTRNIKILRTDECGNLRIFFKKVLRKD